VAITPEVLDQELDTRVTTGVIYWEGANRVSGTLNGRPVSGAAYVELTGYASLR
jgi:predicted secreted hydrolase